MREGFFDCRTPPKEALVACGMRLYEQGFLTAFEGNLSVKNSETELWTTPTSVSKGYLSEDMLVRVRLDGRVLEGSAPPSSELPMHLGIYAENPEIHAVVHAHPPAATAFAAAGLPLDAPVLQEAIVLLGSVPLAPYALPGTRAVAESVAPFCRTHKGALLEYHGVVSWGKSLWEALARMETIEQYARVLLHLHTLGSKRQMPPELIAQLTALRAD